MSLAARPGSPRVKPPASQDWFEKVSRLSMDLVTVFDAERLPKRIMQTFAEAAGAKKGSLMMMDKAGERLEIRASLGISEHARRAVKLRPGEGVAGRVAATGKPLLLEDPSAQGIYLDFPLAGGPHDLPRGALLSLPLSHRDEVLGVVNLDERVNGEPFRREDIALLSVLANFAAVALANLRLYEESVTDGLTGLISQKAFHVRLREEFRRAQKYRAFLSLLLIDLDHFKQFNDAHGHPMGDRALVHLAQLLRDSTRAVDVIGRCGGEEFGVILLETDLPSARLVAERIRARLERTPLVAEDKSCPMTMSVGAAAFSPAESGLTPESLVQRADQALYRAKAAGRNQAALWETPS